MQSWLTPAVRGLLALVLVVGAQAAAPRTVAALCGVLPVVVQPVADMAPAVHERSALKSSSRRSLWLALRSE